jgi:hypothetical protein
MCPLLALVFVGFFFWLQPLTVLMKQTRQAVRAVKQSILLRCLWLVATAKMPLEEVKLVAHMTKFE